MTKRTGIALVGAGAFGERHLQALARIEEVEIISIVSRPLNHAQKVAAQYGARHASEDIKEALAREDVDAVILCTPTPLHAEQAIACMAAGKHVMVEIPLADSLAGAEQLLAAQKKTRLVCMAGHTRRFNPSHQWMHGKIKAGEAKLQQMDVQTYFLRRENINAKGEARSWTDHLLWHHAAHTIDLFAHQAGPIARVQALAGPLHPELGIVMDMSIQMKSARGAICTLSLSFNNDGPLGTFFRYICDNGTWIARYDDLETGYGKKVDLADIAVTMDGIELQDREFIAALREGREPVASVAEVMPCYRLLDEIERSLMAQAAAENYAVCRRS